MKELPEKGRKEENVKKKSENRKLVKESPDLGDAETVVRLVVGGLVVEKLSGEVGG